MDIRNPFHSPEAELGLTGADWAAVKAALKTYVQSRPAQPFLTEGELRALHPALADDRTWAHVLGVVARKEL